MPGRCIICRMGGRSSSSVRWTGPTSGWKRTAPAGCGVVDYKTGTKKLDLKEVYCGLDCQMLLYLFSLTRDASGRFTGAEPAGVLYLLADPAPRKHHPRQRRPQCGIQAGWSGAGRGKDLPGHGRRGDGPVSALRLSATARPAPTRRRNAPTRPSSPASSSIWTTL